MYVNELIIISRNKNIVFWLNSNSCKVGLSLKLANVIMIFTIYVVLINESNLINLNNELLMELFSCSMTILYFTQR